MHDVVAHCRRCKHVKTYYTIRACSTGHTEDIAGIIKTQLGDAASDPEDIGDIEVSRLAEYDSLVVGEEHILICIGYWD